MDYAKIKHAVLEVYQKCGVDSFPINCFDLLQQYGYACKEYSEQEEEKQERCFQVSDDAFRLKNIIYYNDLASFRRRRFSLAHELGHVVLGHKAPYTRLMEQEANYFAGQILAPPIAIHYSKCKNATDVSKIFVMTHEAAGYAFDDYRRWRRYLVHHEMSSLDKEMYTHFFNEYYDCFVWNISRCKRCGSMLINNPKDFCGECDYNFAEMKRFNEMIYRKASYAEEEYIPGFNAAEKQREYSYLKQNDLVF